MSIGVDDCGTVINPRMVEGQVTGGLAQGFGQALWEEIVFDETHRYVKRVMEVSAAYAMLYEGRLPRWSNAVDPVVEDNIAF